MTNSNRSAESALRDFHDYFRDRCEMLFMHFGKDAITLFNNAFMAIHAPAETAPATALSDEEILQVFHDLYWSGLIGSTTKSERIPIGRAVLAAAAERLRAAPPAEPGWISVDERLPEQWQFVMVGGVDGVEMAQFTDRGTFAHDVIHDMTEDMYGVTHWMDLPSPPPAPPVPGSPDSGGQQP